MSLNIAVSKELVTYIQQMSN